MINLRTGSHFRDLTKKEEMLTRRNVLTGLGGIIAAGCAPSIALGAARIVSRDALARSANASVGGMMRNVGARNAAMFRSESYPWDYRVEYIGYRDESDRTVYYFDTNTGCDQDKEWYFKSMVNQNYLNWDLNTFGQKGRTVGVNYTASGLAAHPYYGVFRINYLDLQASNADGCRLPSNRIVEGFAGYPKSTLNGYTFTSCLVLGDILPGVMQFGMRCRFYYAYCKSKSTGKTLCNYIPCVYNGVPCVFETLTKSFAYYNATMSAGPRVKDDGSPL